MDGTYTHLQGAPSDAQGDRPLHMIFYSDGGLRAQGAASVAWVGHLFHTRADIQESKLFHSEGFPLDPGSITAFGAELCALEGAVDTVLSLFPRGKPTPTIFPNSLGSADRGQYAKYGNMK